MRTTLVSLHGFTMHGASLRRLLGELEPRLAPLVELSFPDAPHAASPASVDALIARMGGLRPAPPHRQWWNASNDGLAYQGWEESRDALRREVERHPRVGVLGFSQGAAVAAAVSALSCRGDFPPLAFVILIAGFTPRSAELGPLFEPPLQLPSLHIWGEQDSFAKHGPGLAARFAPEQRRIVTWSGHHTVPTEGEAADALLEFVGKFGAIAPVGPT